jgi:8-oxo-dGTP pyrophosphatase MutT (NUDIX family)
LNYQLCLTHRQVTINQIQQRLSEPLPGPAGQFEMAPQRLPGQPNRWAAPADCREAGVLLLFYPQRANGNWSEELHLVLTRRPEYPGVHSGQMSFPGGRREAGESLRATALRETLEEVGVLPETLQVIGALSPLYTPPSNFCIHPFIAYSPVQPQFQPDEKEVAELVEVPLSLLFDPAIRKEEVWEFKDYGPRRVPFFDIYGHKVWGATAMILNEFLVLWR